MIADYRVAALVFGIAAAVVFIIRRFSVSEGFKEETEENGPANIDDAFGSSTTRPSSHRESDGLSPTPVSFRL